MSRFILGDYVRPIDPNPGLPRDSVWLVAYYTNRDTGSMRLYEVDKTTPGYYPEGHVQGRLFPDSHFEKVLLVGGQWMAAKPSTGKLDLVFMDDCDESVTNVQEEEYPVEYADKLVERAVATLDAAKENVRKAREEAQAAAKAKAKRWAAAQAAKRAREEHEAISARLHKDRDLAVATVALIAELSRLHNGGAEQTASPAIAAHAEQLQPLAKSYGYKIAKPGVIAIVIKA